VKVQDTPTQCTYTLDDGTGRAELKMWVDDSTSTELKSELRPGVYVRAFGNLRHFQGSRGLVAYALRPVADYNEITFHCLEVVLASRQLKAKHSGAGLGLAPRLAAVAGGVPPATGPYGSSAYAPPAAGRPVTGNVSSDVLGVFQSPAGRGDSGMSLDQVFASLQGRYTKEAIKSAVETAVNEGHLYSTTDDQHYKSTQF